MRNFSGLAKKLQIAALVAVIGAFGSDAVFRDATATSNNDIDLANTAVAAIVAGELDSAIATLTGLLESGGGTISDEDLAAILFNRAYARQLKGQTEAAIADYDAVLAVNSDDGPAYLNRGIAQESLAQYRNALADYSAAVAIDPENAMPLFNRASLLSEMGELENAIIDFNTLVRLDSDNPEYVVALDAAMELAANKTVAFNAPSDPGAADTNGGPNSSAMAFEMFEWDYEGLAPYAAADQASIDECGGIVFADPNTGRSFLVQSEAQAAGSYCRITLRQD